MQRHFTGLLLRPSFFSSITNTCAVVLILGAANWSDFLQKIAVYNYLFGADGLVTHLTNGSEGGELLGASVNYNVLILGTAVFVGIAVYIILQIMSRVANDASATWESLHAQTDTGIKAIAGRAGIRIIVAMSWLFYAAMFMKAILPFCIVASQVGIRELWEPAGFGYLLFGAALLWFGLHLHTIFIRLLFLRPRVFGGNDEILTDEFRNR